MTCEKRINKKMTIIGLGIEEISNTIPQFDELAEYSRNVQKRYDMQRIGKIASKVNDVIKQVQYNATYNVVDDSVPVTVEDIPILIDHVNSTPISPIEIVEFVEDVSYDEDQLEAELEDTPDVPLNALENFMNKNISQSIAGGFCGAFAGVLSQLAQLTTLISDAVSTINQLQNYTDLSVPVLLNMAKEKVFQIIDAIIEKYAGQALQMLQRGVSVLGASNFNLVGLAERMSTEYARIMQTFDEDNIKTMKEKFEELFARMAGQFEEITPDDLSYLLFRICQFNQLLEGVMSAPLDILRGTVTGTQGNIRTYEASYDYDRTIRQTVAGIETPDRSTVETMRETARDNLSSQQPTASTSPVGRIPSSREKALSPQITPQLIIEANTWDIQKSGGRFTKVENKWITLAPSVMNMGVDWSDANDRDGWEVVNKKVWAMAWLLAERLGRKLTITSAYRSPRKNASLPGAASYSYHMAGLALDVLTPASEAVDFIKNISIIGATGIGYYHGQGFIHFDIGTANPRYWAKNNYMPADVKEAIMMHISNGTSQGPFWVDEFRAPTTSTATTGSGIGQWL